MEMKNRKKLHNAEKNEKGDPSVSSGFANVRKYFRLCGDEKIEKKVAQCRKKNEKGDPSVSSGFANARKYF